MAFQPNFRMVRADDQLVLDVALEGMTTAVSATGGRVQVLQLANANTPGRIRLIFQPQQVLEYARDTQGVRLFQPRPIFAPPTTIVLTVPANTPPVPATVAGVLDLARRLALVTDGGTVSAERAPSPAPRLPAAHGIAATRAAETGRPADPDVLRRRQIEQARRTPRAQEVRRADQAAAAGPTTEIAFPYLLTVRLPGGDTRLSHPITPTPNQSRVPLWTTELGVTNGQRGSISTASLTCRR